MEEDELGYVTPSKPSELRMMSDAELGTLYRKLAFANQHPFSAMIEHEVALRHVAALKAHSEATLKSGQRLEWLTWALVGLTIVLVVLTIVLLAEG